VRQVIGGEPPTREEAGEVTSPGCRKLDKNPSIHEQAPLHTVLHPTTGSSSAAVATEREFEHLLRRLAAHSHAVNAVLQAALALRRTPDAITARDVEGWTPAI